MNDLLFDLAEIVGEDNIFAYADDLLIICDSKETVELVISKVKLWS